MKTLVVLVALMSRSVAAPMHALPQASNRAASTGPALYVDAAHGDDAADGTAGHPWKTIAHALKSVKAGDTLYLHGGIYFESITTSVSGTQSAPVTIRSAPGEVAIIDGGLREFFDSPKTAWQPFEGG